MLHVIKYWLLVAPYPSYKMKKKKMKMSKLRTIKKHRYSPEGRNILLHPLTIEMSLKDDNVFDFLKLYKKVLITSEYTDFIKGIGM